MCMLMARNVALLLNLLHQSEQVTVRVTEFGLIKKLLRSCDFKTILSNPYP